MVIFQYNLYIFGIHLWTVLYPKPCNNELCYKEVVVYLYNILAMLWVLNRSDSALRGTSNEYIQHVFMEK